MTDNQNTKKLDLNIEEVDYSKMGSLIQKLRKEEHFTQTDLARMVGCSTNHISRIESGKMKPSLSMLIKISHALKQDLNYFIPRPSEFDEYFQIKKRINQKLEKLNAKKLSTYEKILDALIEEES